MVKTNFPLLSAGWYLFRVVSGNRYLLRGSNKKAYCNGNVFVARLVVPLVTKPFFDFVMIHWIRWIHWNSFRVTLLKGGCSRGPSWESVYLGTWVLSKENRVQNTQKQWWGSRYSKQGKQEPFTLGPVNSEVYHMINYSYLRQDQKTRFTASFLLQFLNICRDYYSQSSPAGLN